MDSENLCLLIGLVTGLTIGSGIMILYFYSSTLSQETMQDICQNIENNYTIEYNTYASQGKLVCEKPSFDNTQNIIIRDNGGKE